MITYLFLAAMLLQTGLIVGAGVNALAETEQVEKQEYDILEQDDE